jgi:hypothetical protein
MLGNLHIAWEELRFQALPRGEDGCGEASLPEVWQATKALINTTSKNPQAIWFETRRAICGEMALP